MVVAWGTGKINTGKKKHGKKTTKLPRVKKNTGKKKHNLFYTPIRKVVSFLYLNSKNYSKQISGLTTECILFTYKKGCEFFVFEQ